MAHSLRNLITKNSLLPARSKQDLIVQLESMDACEQEGILRIFKKQESKLSEALIKTAKPLPLKELKKITKKMRQAIHNKGVEKAEQDLNRSFQ